MVDGNNKKDLTGIFELPQATPFENESVSGSFSTETEIEKIDAFESIDQIGMMDHETLTEASPEPPISSAPSEDHFDSIEETSAITDDTDLPLELSTAPPPPASDFLAEIKTYSEQAKNAREEIRIHYPFHLSMEGTFGPFERDKLLLFITENQIGISSNDLDLQLKSGRALFPRISEYAGIKLIQELRDSGLQFNLKPSPRDEDELTLRTSSQNFHFEASPEIKSSPTIEIPILPASPQTFSLYTEIDTLQSSQYLKAEMIEANQTDHFQEVVERMLEKLKQKTKAMNGHALTHLEQKITPLRLPSQYHLFIQATVLRKK